MIACDTPSTMAETRHRVEGLEVDAVQVGALHLVLPVSQVGRVLRVLREHGHYPRLIGDALVEVGDRPEADDGGGRS